MHRFLYYHVDLSAAPEILLMRQLLSSEDVVADVGANIGYFSLVAAKYAGRVFAIEASPSTCVKLRQNLSLNPDLAQRIQDCCVGLAAEEGSAVLYNSLAQPDLASLQPLTCADTYTETIHVTTLDALLGEERLSFLKIDVEGGEWAVLQGAAQHLQRDRPLMLVELIELFQMRSGSSCQTIVDHLQQLHYSGWIVTSSQSGQPDIKIEPLDLALLPSDAANNVLFVPDEKRGQVFSRLNCHSTPL
jgi:FkbM family methyltransferase